MANETIEPLPSFFQSVDPTLKDVLEMFKKDIFINMNCVAIGTIQSFTPADCTATVTVNYTRVFVQMDSVGNQSNTSKPYPLLMQVPCVVLSGGAAGLTLPIQAGDSCVVLFNDRDFSNWFASGNAGAPPASLDHHGIGNGIALVGVRAATNPIVGYDMTRAKLYNGTTEVGVSSSKVRIKNSTDSLKQLLDATNGILKILNDLNTALVVPTGIDAANKALITTAISTLNTKIGGLLE